MTPTQSVKHVPPATPPEVVAIRWPAPHHMRVIDPGAGVEPERALVSLHGGEKVLGTIQRIDFDKEFLELRLETGAPRAMPFATFRSLFLSRAIELERIPMAVPPGGVEARPHGVRHRCIVEFKEGDPFLNTEVISILPQRAGLFLFAIDATERVTRWFIPAAAIAKYRIGEPLGQMLRAQKAVTEQDLEAGLQTQRQLRSKKIGEYLAEDALVTREDLEGAFQRQNERAHPKLGDLLVREGLITAEQRDTALAAQASDRRKMLGEILVEKGLISNEDIRRFLTEQLGVPTVNLSRFRCDPDAVKLITAEIARRNQVMPLYRTGSRLAVAIENPLSWESLHQVEFYTELKVDPAIASPSDIAAAINQYYGEDKGEQIAELIEEIGVKEAPSHPTEEHVTHTDHVLLRLVNKIIVDAYDRGASDIHVESMPNDKPGRVRFRIDGVLSHYMHIAPSFRAAMISRIKIMSALDITERRRPQDGRIRFENFGPRRIELRVVTLPTAHGSEDVVMRILAAPRVLSVDQLGLSPRTLEELRPMLARTFGLLFVCGPTGSGKTTTLHSLLSHINVPERKIWTVEDPIEISQEGLCQVQVNAKIGLTFAALLRSFLRADPDVIMVGETRDEETARTVTAAALTGHLVFSTMHTNSAVESIVRLLDIGVDPFNFADALIGVIGQRLVRRLCPDCRTPRSASQQEIQALAHEYCRDLPLDPAQVMTRWRSRYASGDGSVTLQGPAGCERCDQTGYKGRMGVYELLVASPAVKQKIQAKASVAELVGEAVGQGMTTFKQHAIEKILQGHLDLKQVQESCL